MSVAQRGGMNADLARVRALCDLKRYDDAAGLARRAVGLDGANAYAWCLLAQAELGRGDHQAALAAASGARSLQPEGEWPHRLVAYALDRLGRHDEAVRSAREAVRLEPHAWQAHVTLARLLSNMRSDGAEALRSAERAVALAPHETQAHLTYALVSGASGRHDEAEAAVQRALELDPQDAAAHNELARLHLRRARFGRADRLASAATTFANAVQLDPHETVVRTNLDTVLYAFLRRTSWYVLLVAVAPVSLFGGSTAAGRLVPVLLLGVPCWFARRFWNGLTPQLRRHLRDIVLGRKLRIAMSLLAFAVVCLLGSVAVPGLAYLASPAALLARFSLRRNAARAGVTIEVDRERAVRFLLWLLTGGLALVALELFGGVEGLSGVPGLFAGLLCAGGSVMAFLAVRRRSAAR